MGKIKMENDKMIVWMEKQTGNIVSVKLKQDALGTEFIGNQENISYSEIQRLNQWTGDLRFRVWSEDDHEWQEELTSCSQDTRTVLSDKESLTVSYEHASENEKGIKSLKLYEQYSMREDGFHWFIDIVNPADKILEVGELSLAFLTNTDYTGVFEDEQYEGSEHWRGEQQRIWHEQRIQQHLSINGGSSYAFLQRPKGDYPAVIFQAADDTEIETAYQMDKRIGCQWSLTFEGPYYLSLYSGAARKCEGWKYETEQQSYGMNGNRSLLMRAGERKRFHFVFHVVEEEAQVKEWLFQEGQLDVEVQPAMVVPAEIPIQMRIRCKNRLKLVPAANNMKIEEIKAEGDSYFYRLEFSQPGQKKIQVFHGNRKTTLLFYGTDNIKRLLENHAEFIVTRQYYENEQDPYGRHHAFLPYDDALEMLFTESEESWQVGALDEYALPVAMYVAEKNAVCPKESQIRVLEEYIDDCLYGTLQQKDTYYARRGMYYEERTPFDIFTGNKWDKEKAESVLRSFNYPLITNIYLSMYRIADRYRLTKLRSKEEYLEMAYRTAMVGYELGRNKFNGAPAGATVTELLEVLKKEREDWFESLNQKMAFIAEENAGSEYPFGSELYVDQTSHNQYEAMMVYYGKKEKLSEAYRITCALRGGFQPAWFLYGNEKRGNVCCWYGTPLNSRVLFDGFEYTGNQTFLKLGFGGLFSFLTCIRSNGAAHGWFLWWPDRTGFDLRSLDTDMGMYGYLKAAKSYVVDDDVFGRCGYGCTWEKTGECETIVPYDGIGIRFVSVPHAISVECEKGSMKKIVVDGEKNIMQITTESFGDQKCHIFVCAAEEWKILTEEEAEVTFIQKERECL